MNTSFIDIPTWENGTWSVTSFETRDEYKDFVLSVFKEPGLYEMDETSLLFNEQARLFNQNGLYCTSPQGTKDYIAYWNHEKNKCRYGAIFKNSGKTWYLPRDYYMWLNFLPIFNKEIQKFGFADVRDAQYHMALYELLAELHYKHCSILKKRQIASSYYHMGKMINQIWFEEGITLKVGASLKDYINDKGSWKFLNEYEAFLNKHTAWYRPMNPGKVLLWQQKIEIVQGSQKRKTEVGLKGVLQGMSFEKDPTNGVGGPCKYFFHEEAGIAPKMDTTFEYIRPAMRSGFVTTGMFIAAGSVGDLDQCEPLKEMTLRPDPNDIYAVDTNLIDSKGTHGRSGLFIPEQWSMPPFIDDYGNSKVEDALKALDEQFEKWKKDLSPEQYQLRISQHPRNIEEAFAYRKVSIFPLNLIGAQMRRIEDKQYPIEYLDIHRDEKGDVDVKPTSKLPIMEFPVDKKREDKTGVFVCYERPVKNPEFGMYYASIDPVGEGKAEHVDNMLYTPAGRKRIGDIQIGDKVIGSNGETINVIGVYPQGTKKMCKLTFNDGHAIKVCEDHLWNVKLNGGTKDYITLSVKDLLDTTKTITYTGTGKNSKKEYTIPTYYKDKQNRNRWSIPIVKPINFQPKGLKKQNEWISKNEQPIHPYLLGALLGDGGLSQRTIRFSSVDQGILDKIQSCLPDGIQLKKVKGDNCDYSIVTKKGNRNSLSKKLKDLGLMGCKSEHKFIPYEYKYALITQRILLLNGLLDTDGSCTNNGVEFYSSSKQLAYDVVELVQSLGGIAKIRKKKTTCLDSYIVRVKLPRHINPFFLSRKRNKYKPSKVFSRYITNIEYIDNAEAVCISVDSADNLYVTEHALVTHNTTTSESLCSIYVYKTAVEVTRNDGEKVETFVERDKIVAAWCGRFDDINKTHERLEMIIEWYNAWTIVENNISQFINHMLYRKKQKYLVPRSQILFLKDLGANANVFQEYGWRNTGTLFKSHMLSYAIDFLKEELDQEVKSDGEIVKTIYGVERIPDIMLLTEMAAYQEGLNVDRLVSFAALIAFAKVQQANRGYKKRYEETDKAKKLDKRDNFSKLNMSPFRHIGGSGSAFSGMKIPKQPFRNLR
jgi:hypothetical protein